MAICGCGLPACCCQPAVAGSVIYADLRGELSTHLAPQALFTQSSPVRELLLQAFPFPSTLVEVTLHLLSQASMFIYSSRGKWVLPLSCDVFLPPLLLQAFLLLAAGHVLPLPSSPARSGLFIYSSMRDSPPPSLALRAPHLLCYVSLLLLLLITQFFFFSLGGGWSVQGAMLIWPRIVCGSTMYCLAHLVVHVFPRHLAPVSGSGMGALLVSPFNVKWRCSAQAGGVEGSKFCLFLVVLPAR
jgi:hypothetical protein